MFIFYFLKTRIQGRENDVLISRDFNGLTDLIGNHILRVRLV